MPLQMTKFPVARAGMLIRKPADEIYEAFVDPNITTRFWFTKSSGRLEVGKRLRWEWEMNGASTTLEVKKLEPWKSILVDWGLEDRTTTMDWTFTPRGNNTTFVDITNYGFTGDGDTVVDQAMGSTAGFGLVLAGLKAYLEYGIILYLIADRFPDQVVNQWAVTK